MTNPYSDADLEAMLSDLESELVERKESLRKAPPGKDGPIERIRQAVGAFANDLPGHRRPGVVFVGARDDGTPSGIPRRAAGTCPGPGLDPGGIASGHRHRAG